MADPMYQRLPQLEVSDSSEPPRWANASRAWARKGRRPFLLIGLLIVVALASIAVWTPGFDAVHSSKAKTDLAEVEGGLGEEVQPVLKSCPVPPEEPWMHPASSLNFGYPATTLRENLRDDTYYVTSFAQAGFTNQFIACLHLIYLGHLTGRVPVIPPIVPAAHISSTAGLLPFSSIFNLTLLRAALRAPVIEWHDGKHIAANASVSFPTSSSDPALDHFGCWSTRPLSANHAGYVENDENALRIDMSFTRVPKHVYFNPSNENDMHTTFYGLSSITTPGHRHAAAAEGRLAIMHPSRLGKKTKPEERMSCFDMLYYVSTGVREFEFEEPWSPAWARVGKFLRFADGLEGIGLAYVRKAFGLENGEAIPPLITVHIRRGDFGGNCKPGEKPPCFLPLSAYKDSVEDVRKEIFEKHKIEANLVLVASNEDDPAFWKTIDSYGWKYLNHTSSRTVETYGEWHPLLLDKVALSLGVGFVGTMPSTFSVYNARRVEDWNDGVTRLLNYWSYKPPVKTT